MLSTVDLPRKWSTRWTWSSGTRRGQQLVERLGGGRVGAERLLQHQPGAVGQLDVGSASQAFAVTAGGSAKKITTWPSAGVQQPPQVLRPSVTSAWR